MNSLYNSNKSIPCTENLMSVKKITLPYFRFSAHYEEDSAHYKGVSAHYGTDSAHYMEVSAHYGEDSAHYKEFSAHYKTDSAHYFQSNRYEKRKKTNEKGRGAAWIFFHKGLPTDRNRFFRNGYMSRKNGRDIHYYNRRYFFVTFKQFLYEQFE
jgi:hypothetical protein